jgi:hypothetical protein
MNEPAEKKRIETFERKLSRIERWLKRCLSACKCSSWSSAMMEIECMEAEAREFRSELWNLVSGEGAGRPRGLFREALFVHARAVALAVALVMAAELPLSKDQDRPLQAFSGESIALISSTESDILAALRESLSNQNAGRVVLSIELPAPDEGLKNAGAAAAAEPEMTAPSREPVQAAPTTVAFSSKENEAQSESGVEEKAPDAGPTVEEVISLIQIGQRALRVSEPAVRVVPLR